VVAPVLEAHPNDHRLHLRRGLALAEHFVAGPAFESTDRALLLCQQGSEHPCSEAEQDRIRFLRDALSRVKDVDMRADPNTAKKRLIGAMRPGWANGKRLALPPSETATEAATGEAAEPNDVLREK
jgi:hypothetical protein